MDNDNFLVTEAHLALDQARKEKAERIKTFGEPIELPGKALAIEIHGDVAWIAENTAVVRKLDVESGKTLQLLKGHSGPVTSLVFCGRDSSSDKKDILITGSWDKSIKLWDTNTGQLISTTPDAHADFVKSLHVFPSLRLLISGGSDKIIRFWDLSELGSSGSLKSSGSISSHTRPVECLDGQALSANTAVLYTGDTMGVVKVWYMHKDTDSDSTRWNYTLQDTIDHHRTRINELVYGNGQLWTGSASADETVRVIPNSISESAIKAVKIPKSINHPVGVRAILPLFLTDLAEPYVITAAGDVLRVFDVSSLEEPEMINEIDGHWHDITAIRLWLRKSKSKDGKTRVEPWIVTTSLDKTIRKWKLADLLNPPPPSSLQVTRDEPETPVHGMLTEEEERELAELMGDD